MRRIGCVLLLCLVAACGGGSSGKSATPSTPKLLAVAQKCDPGGKVLTVADNDQTLIVDLFSFKPPTKFVCALNAIGTPTSIRNRITQTTQLQGQLSDDSGGYHYNWSYNGQNDELNMEITVATSSSSPTH